MGGASSVPGVRVLPVQYEQLASRHAVAGGCRRGEFWGDAGARGKFGDRGTAGTRPLASAVVPSGISDRGTAGGHQTRAVGRPGGHSGALRKRVPDRGLGQFAPTLGLRSGRCGVGEQLLVRRHRRWRREKELEGNFEYDVHVDRFAVPQSRLELPACQFFHGFQHYRRVG